MRGWVAGGARGGALALLVMALLAGMALIMPGSGAGAAPAGPGATWQVQDSPDVTVPYGKIQGVSCPSAAACVAVGYYLNASGRYAPFAERQDGTSWQQEVVPAPAGATAPGLNGVSCVKADFCAAVGVTNDLLWAGNTGFADVWRGSSWTPEAFPSPKGAITVQVTAVSCVSASFCEAVGGYENTSGAVRSLAERWNGTRWTLQSTPSSPGGAAMQTELDGVSCVSARFCQAVDYYAYLTEEWNGTSWSLRSVPIPRGAYGQGLDVVSCSAANFCEALGTFSNPKNTVLAIFADRWNGASWHSQSVPSPANWQIPTAVSCVSARLCESVGYKEVYVAGAGVDTFRAIAEVWTGTSWKSQAARSVAGTAPTELTGLSCATAKACEAGGSFPVMEAWNGTSWAMHGSVTPGGATDNTLKGVSCVTATFCEAVGNGFAGTGIAAAQWNGIAWQPQPTPGLAYSAVSCATQTFCVAVGESGAATWNGTSWSSESLPAAPGYYTSVSCVSASACEAAGPGLGGNDTAGFAAGWNGLTWTAQPIPGPAGTGRLIVTAVSCTAAGACEAVGESTKGAFAAGWDGAAWTSQGDLPVPSGAIGDFIAGVACTSPTACTAVGYSEGTGGYSQQTLAQTWDGTSWSIQATPDPGRGDQLFGVSCVAAGPCVAVGSDRDPGNYDATLVEASGH